MADASGMDYQAEPPDAFDEDKLAEAADRASRMVDMTQTSGWEHFRDAIISKTTTMQRRLVGGDYEDFDAYQRDAHYVRGLLDALKVPEETLSLIEEKRRLANRLKEPTPDERTE